MKNVKSRRKILVAVDGSDCSARALEFALARIGDANGASIIVLNVQPAMPPSQRVTRGMIHEHQSRQSAEDLRVAQRVLKRGKAAAEIVVKVGDPAAQIIATAKSRRCSEIVLGNNGHGVLADLLLGSVADKVIRLAPCPVTVVK